jgi:dTDP-4-amino-4,6-dideoxygalactose transaminase
MTYVTDDDPGILPFGRAAAKLGLLEVANLNAKLKLFPLIQKSKDAMKAFYAEHLAGIPGVRTIPDPEGTYSVRQHVVAEFDRRDELLAFLRGRDISIDPAYPPVSASKLFGKYVQGERFPMAERYHARVAHLPSTPFIGRDDLTRVVDAIREFYGVPPTARAAATPVPH